MQKLTRKFEPAPCTGCANKRRCEDDRVACERFAYYAETGRISGKFTLTPSKGMYVRTYHGAADKERGNK